VDKLKALFSFAKPWLEAKAKEAAIKAIAKKLISQGYADTEANRIAENLINRSAKNG